MLRSLIEIFIMACTHYEAFDYITPAEAICYFDLVFLGRPYVLGTYHASELFACW